MSAVRLDEEVFEFDREDDEIESEYDTENVDAELSDERVVWAKTDVDKNATIAINNVKRLNMIFSFPKIKTVFYNVQSKTFPTYEGTRK